MSKFICYLVVNKLPIKLSSAYKGSFTLKTQFSRWVLTFSEFSESSLHWSSTLQLFGWCLNWNCHASLLEGKPLHDDSNNCSVDRGKNQQQSMYTNKWYIYNSSSVMFYAMSASSEGKRDYCFWFCETMHAKQFPPMNFN